MAHRTDIPEIHFACLVGHVLYLRNIARFLCQKVNLPRMLTTPIGPQALYKHNSQEQTLLNIDRQKTNVWVQITSIFVSRAFVKVYSYCLLT